MRRDTLRATVIAACLTAVAWASPGGGGPDGATTATLLPFLTYVLSPDQAATLVAFSPTHHDPRPGVQHQVPSPASLQADLAVLRPAFDGLVLYGYEPEVTPYVVAEAVRQGYRALLLYTPRMTPHLFSGIFFEDF